MYYGETKNNILVISKEKPAISRKMVVKLGSDVTTRQDGSLNTHLIDSISWQIGELFINSGVKTALVVSGAVKHGRHLLKRFHEDEKLEDLQLEAARGNIHLQMAFVRGFDKKGINSFPQVFSDADLASPRVVHLVNEMMENGIPIINANDSVNDIELRNLSKCADNDKLAGFVTAAVNADTLAILTQSAGIHDTNEEIVEDGYSIRPGKNVIFSKGNGIGPGGPGVKYGICKRLAGKGVRTIIAKAEREGIILDIARNLKPQEVTLFDWANRH